VTGLGISDVLYSLEGSRGLIELKYIKEWPKRKTTTVKIKHFTKEQKLFLYKHGRESGLCFLFLRVGKKDFLLFDHLQAQNLGKLTKDQMIKKSLAYWKKSIDFTELRFLLRGNREKKRK
jgi:penicillin-binding protein-related factor A (putative recombinase)